MKFKILLDNKNIKIHKSKLDIHFSRKLFTKYIFSTTSKIFYILLFVSLFFVSCHKEKPWWWVPETFAENPCWTPDGAKIAYRREQQIWITDTLGNTWNMFEGVSMEARLPDFSPDGRWMVFVSGTHIYKVLVKNDWKIDGSTIIKLTEIGRNYSPKWSQIFDTIVYDSNIKNDSIVTFYGICIMDTSGTTKRRIEGTRGDARHPDWSPNSDKVVYYGFFETTGDYPQIAIFSFIDSQITQLTFDSSWKTDPAWSSDGNCIAFYKSIEGPDESGIWLISPTGANLKKLTTGGQPAWSTDNRKIAFIDLDRSGEYGTIWLIDLISKKRKQIVYKEE